MDPASFDPAPGVPVPLAPGLQRILAPNPSQMTFRGTNTYLVGRTDVAVIDPGPNLAQHCNAILSAIGPGQRISHILVTHPHLDHSALAPALSRLTGAPVLAFGPPSAGRSARMHRLVAEGLSSGGEGVDTDFAPDICLPDGAVVTGSDWQITALWTPGHMSSHMAFVWQDALLSGDLVMGWSSSIVSPPDGDLGDSLASCRRLARHPAKIHYPGHGAPITDPKGRIDWLLSHRAHREAQILTALAQSPASIPELVDRIYADLAPGLRTAASRNVLAHLVDLCDRSRVTARPRLSETADFQRI
ncbi:MBL fold metallo-hydrolase [Pseudoruegeria sp. SK021]|uniref:MBL fold metallo-hydrolase n=1 Tax=Pseudoruegeria sp. SK021 TaxID=1933035 RepID=UPI000A240747|nr:MBL fold metallo-hydrolase [Pseudoruegeria sp. SK021]OSP53828.1 MBL fold metallo-hydrolase [Pseudoruegeria sp. SK021]